jgi:hypothetical protein
MKTIHHPDTYICEICGTEYKLRANVELCESLPIEEVKFQVGDKVKVESRYDGLIEVEIVEILPPQAQAGMKFVDNMLEKGITKELIHDFHPLLYKVSEYIEICKDGSTSNKFESRDLIKVENNEQI